MQRDARNRCIDRVFTIWEGGFLGGCRPIDDAWHRAAGVSPAAGRRLAGNQPVADRSDQRLGALLGPLIGRRLRNVAERDSEVTLKTRRESCTARVNLVKQLSKQKVEVATGKLELRGRAIGPKVRTQLSAVQARIGDLHLRKRRSTRCQSGSERGEVIARRHDGERDPRAGVERRRAVGSSAGEQSLAVDSRADDLFDKASSDRPFACDMCRDGGLRKVRGVQPRPSRGVRQSSAQSHSDRHAEMFVAGGDESERQGCPRERR